MMLAWKQNKYTQALISATGLYAAATRLGDRLGIQTAWMTILRRMMALPTIPVGQVSQLGIDDFSCRRDRKFGTILVDMRSHQTIDLLPDRKVETATAWMAAHPEIELVSRDRAGGYASAAAVGAPQAVQCADRFHVLKNLREVLEGLLAHHLARERKRQAQAQDIERAPAWQSKRSRRYSPNLQQLHQARRQECMALYHQEMAVHKQGLRQQAIAERVRESLLRRAAKAHR